eukprot:TRINITY_DN1154_c0_g1_i1.p2 TRINITY_DN1154_c0_g1~~TRINITY_DN1154_c0_g1_i1.p2  ORF type:complete len:823 (+),score=241.63 TRINITY_DN1154_c0_g1_i1:64-2532(+)
MAYEGDTCPVCGVEAREDACPDVLLCYVCRLFSHAACTARVLEASGRRGPLMPMAWGEYTLHAYKCPRCCIQREQAELHKFALPRPEVAKRVGRLAVLHALLSPCEVSVQAVFDGAPSVPLSAVAMNLPRSSEVVALGAAPWKDVVAAMACDPAITCTGDRVALNAWLAFPQLGQRWRPQPPKGAAPAPPLLFGLETVTPPPEPPPAQSADWLDQGPSARQPAAAPQEAPPQEQRPPVVGYTLRVYGEPTPSANPYNWRNLSAAVRMDDGVVVAPGAFLEVGGVHAAGTKRRRDGTPPRVCEVVDVMWDPQESDAQRGYYAYVRWYVAAGEVRAARAAAPSVALETCDGVRGSKLAALASIDGFCDFNDELRARAPPRARGALPKFPPRPDAAAMAEWTRRASLLAGDPLRVFADERFLTLNASTLDLCTERWRVVTAQYVPPPPCVHEDGCHTCLSGFHTRHGALPLHSRWFRPPGILRARSGGAGGAAALAAAMVICAAVAAPTARPLCPPSLTPRAAAGGVLCSGTDASDATSQGTIATTQGVSVSPSPPGVRLENEGAAVLPPPAADAPPPCTTDYFFTYGFNTQTLGFYILPPAVETALEAAVWDAAQLRAALRADAVREVPQRVSQLVRGYEALKLDRVRVHAHPQLYRLLVDEEGRPGSDADDDVLEGLKETVFYTPLEVLRVEAARRPRTLARWGQGQCTERWMNAVGIPVKDEQYLSKDHLLGVCRPKIYDDEMSFEEDHSVLHDAPDADDAGARDTRAAVVAAFVDRALSDNEESARLRAEACSAGAKEGGPAALVAHIRPLLPSAASTSPT